MAFGASITGSDTIPISQGYKENAGFKAAQLSAISHTDGSSNESAPWAFHHASGTVLLLASATYTTNATAAGSPYLVGPYAELAVDINITAKAGTSPTIQFFIDRIGADGIAYNIWTSASVSTSPTQVSTSIGSGFSVAQSFGTNIQLRWAVGGTSPSWTFSVSIIGK